MAFFSPITSDTPVVADKGEGVFIFDEAGKKYLDGSCGAMTAGLGHNNKKIIEAMKKQLDSLAFVYRSQFTSKPLEDLCDSISKLAPGNLDHVSLANSGSEAAELAMKLAYSYWTVKGKPSKTKIISRWSSYHGSTVGALSMSGNAGRRKEYYPYLSDYPLLELPYCYRCPYEKTYPECDLFCGRYLETLINRIGKDNISAVIFEPITGASGAGISPPDDYFPLMEKICRENEILLIMDEVITGFGRTGDYFASKHWGLEPDMIVFGKGITGGYFPLSGVIASDEIYKALEEKGMKFSTGHTYGGNPLACATGLATLEYIQEEDIPRRAREKGEILEKGLVEMKNRQSLIGDVRGRGLLWGLELVDNRAGANSKPEDKKLFRPGDGITAKLVEACFNNGLIVYPSNGFMDGIHGDSILISPPMVINEEEIKLLLELLEKSLKEIKL